MFNWFDLMRQAQGGAAFDNMARQFGISPEQVQRATAALLPAFAMGLQRTANNPTAMEQFFKLMSAGPYPNFFESATQAFSPQARQEGTTVLNQLFGSDEVSHRVAQQAAAVSGVGVEILQQMLPLMAGIFAGGLAQFARASPMTAALNLDPKPTPSPGQTGLGAWTDMWSNFLGQGMRPASTPQNPAPGSFDEMMASFLAAQRGPAARSPDSPKQESPQPDAAKPGAAGALEAWGQMMESAREMQQQHLASLQSIFDSMSKSGADKDPRDEGDKAP